MQLQAKEPSWKLALLEYLLDKLYRPAKNRLNAELENLLTEHRHYCKLSVTDTVHTYFEGNSYLLPPGIPGLDADKYIDLDPKFHKNMADIQEDTQDLNREREELKIFFRKLMNECVTQADAEIILPKSFYKASLTVTPSMTDEQANKFRKENLASIELIKRRMVENLLAR